MKYFKVYINFINHSEVIIKNKGKPLSCSERFLLSYIANFPEKQGFTGSVENLKFIAKKNRNNLMKTLKKLCENGILEKTDIPHFRTKRYQLAEKFQTLYNKIKRENERYFYVRLDFLDEVDEIDVIDMMLISYISSFEVYEGLQRDLCNVVGVSENTLRKRLQKMKNEVFIIDETHKIKMCENMRQNLYFHTLKV